MNRAFNFLLGAAIGGFIGATVAILLAPSSGDDLRSEIGMRTERIRSEVAKAAADRRASRSARRGARAEVRDRRSRIGHAHGQYSTCQAGRAAGA